MKKDRDIIKLKFNVDPCQGFADLAVGIAPDGYRFLKMERQGKHAVVYYKAIQPKKS